MLSRLARHRGRLIMRSLIRILAALPYALILALFIKLISAWNRLPESVAVHFDLSSKPNSWVSKSSFGIIVVGAGLFIAALNWWVLSGRAGSASLNLIISQALVALTVILAFWETIHFNVEGAPFRPWFVFVPVLLLIGFLIAQSLMPGGWRTRV